MTSSTRSYKPVTPFMQVGWARPPSSPARSVVSFGAGLLDAHKQLRTERSENERALEAVGWLVWTCAGVWTVAPDAQGQQLSVRSRKLGNGVEVVGEDGVVPMHVRRGSNGWTCSASGMPIASDLPLSPWLAEAVHATWTAIR